MRSSSRNEVGRPTPRARGAMRSSRCPARIAPHRFKRGISSSWRVPRTCSAGTTTTSADWEADSVEDVHGYVDSTLGDSSENLCYDVDAEQAFARQPLGIPQSAAIG